MEVMVDAAMRAMLDLAVTPVSYCYDDNDDDDDGSHPLTSSWPIRATMAGVLRSPPAFATTFTAPSCVKSNQLNH